MVIAHLYNLSAFQEALAQAQPASSLYDVSDYHCGFYSPISKGESITMPVPKPIRSVGMRTAPIDPQLAELLKQGQDSLSFQQRMHDATVAKKIATAIHAHTYHDFWLELGNLLTVPDSIPVGEREEKLSTARAAVQSQARILGEAFVALAEADNAITDLQLEASQQQIEQTRATIADVKKRNNIKD